jgi:hypothetical protein
MTTWQTMTHDEKRAEIMRLLALGLGRTQIARSIEGATSSGIAGFRNRNMKNIPNAIKSWPDMTREEKYEKIKAMALDGHSEASIGRIIPDCNKDKVSGFRHNHMRDFIWPNKQNLSPSKRRQGGGFSFKRGTNGAAKRRTSLDFGAPIVDFQTTEFALEQSETRYAPVFIPKTQRVAVQAFVGIPTTLFDRRMIQDAQCAWVLPERSEHNEALVCGAPVAKLGESFCRHHYNIVYQVKIVDKGARNENRT